MRRKGSHKLADPFVFCLKCFQTVIALDFFKTKRVSAGSKPKAKDLWSEKGAVVAPCKKTCVRLPALSSGRYLALRGRQLQTRYCYHSAWLEKGACHCRSQEAHETLC